jgi:hypothetical protein
LQRFNLVRIECHFNVPVLLTVADASEGRAASIYRFFAKKRPAFGDCQCSQTTTDEYNYLELHANIDSDDGQ